MMSTVASTVGGGATLLSPVKWAHEKFIRPYIQIVEPEQELEGFEPKDALVIKATDIDPSERASALLDCPGKAAQLRVQLTQTKTTLTSKKQNFYELKGAEDAAKEEYHEASRQRAACGRTLHALETKVQDYEEAIQQEEKHYKLLQLLEGNSYMLCLLVISCSTPS